MGKKKERAPTPKECLVDEKEMALRVCFDFCYWLENLPGKGGVDGATILLRSFLAQRESDE